MNSVSRFEWVFPLGQALFALALALSFALEHPSAGSVRLSVAGGVMAGGAILGGLAMVQLRHSVRIRPSPHPRGRLEIGGVYRWLRHPMYVAVLALSLGLVLLRPGLWIAALFVAQYAFYWGKARYEERRLLMRYRDYAEYRRHAHGLWP